MTDILSKLFDLEKLPSKIVFLFGVATGIVLFSPASWSESLGSGTLLEHYRPYIGLVFISSLSLLVINFFLFVVQKLQRWQRTISFCRNLPKEIAQLDHAEAAVLREFWVQGKSTVNLPIDNPTVAGLIQKQLIQEVGAIGQRSIYGIIHPMTMNSHLSKLLNKVDVGIPNGDLTHQQIETLRVTRPPFVDSVTRIEDLRNGITRW